MPFVWWTRARGWRVGGLFLRLRTGEIEVEREEKEWRA